jgi:hypothetical protein
VLVWHHHALGLRFQSLFAEHQLHASSTARQLLGPPAQKAKDVISKATRPQNVKHDLSVLVCESVHLLSITHIFSCSIHFCLLAVIYLSSPGRVEAGIKDTHLL